MADATHLVPLPHDLVEEVERAHPGVTLATVLRRALRRQRRCDHELLGCSRCGDVQQRETWVARAAERLREPMLSEFYAEVHDAIEEVMRGRHDGTATSAARAVHGVARRHRLSAAKRLLPPARKFRSKEVDDALVGFYNEVLSELERHATPKRGKAGTVIGFGAVLKQVAIRHGLSNAYRTLPRLAHEHYYGKGGRRGHVMEWDHVEELHRAGASEGRRQQAYWDARERERYLAQGPPAICPRPEDHDEAAAAAVVRFLGEGMTPASAVEELTRQGYRPPRGDNWTELLVRDLSKRAAATTDQLPGLPYRHVVATFEPRHVERWEQLGLAMLTRPGWAFALSEDGGSSIGWKHPTQLLEAHVDCTGTFVLVRGGRNPEDYAYWDFDTTEELLEMVDRQEAGSRPWASRTGGSGRWETYRWVEVDG